MKLSELLESLNVYLADYITLFFVTLLRPRTLLRIIPHEYIESKKPIGFQPKAIPPKTEQKISAKLLGFVLLSIIAGLALHSVMLNQVRPDAQFLISTVATVIIWFLYAALVCLISAKLGGQTSLMETLSISLQIISVTYVVASLAALIWCVIVQVPQIGDTVSRISTWTKTLVDEPVRIHFVFRALLPLIYIPLGLWPFVNSSRSRRHTAAYLLSTGILAIGFSLFGYQLYTVSPKNPVIVFVPSMRSTAIPAPSKTPRPTFMATPAWTPAPTIAPTPTGTPIPTDTPISMPPTDTPVPTPTCTPAPPTATFTPAPPTPTPEPSYPFYVAEQSNREFTHTDYHNIVVYVEILDADGKPLGGYRVVGDSTTGQHFVSDESCWSWCKATPPGGYAKVANVTFEPGPFIDGAWNIYVVDGAGNQVSPVVALSYSTDPSQWVWDHILFKGK